MEKIKMFWRALHAGEQLSNSATWKNRQSAVSAIIVLLGIIAPWMGKMGITISADDLAAIAGGIAAIGGMLNMAAVAATSRKVGLPTGNRDSDDNPIDPSNIMGH